MINVIMLIGKGDSGKTRTLHNFFGTGSWSKGYHDKIINGKIVCAVGFSSPQESELTSFCNYNLVIEDIIERLEIARKEVKKRRDKDDFVFVIPFTLKKKDAMINEDCIIKPIEDLRGKGHNVVPIYLNRVYLKQKQWYDKFMAGLTNHQILSREEYGEQAEDLKNIILTSCT